LKNNNARDKVTKENQGKPERSARFAWPAPPFVQSCLNYINLRDSKFLITINE
jgi:hypothetical protein